MLQRLTGTWCATTPTFLAASLTPNALAAGDVSASKKFMVVMNAATSIIDRSPSHAPHRRRAKLNYTLGVWAAKNGVNGHTMVDYGPIIDAETS